MSYVRAAITVPDHLGEDRHPLANPARLLFAFGTAASACGDDTAAHDAWKQAAQAVGDFAEMTPHGYSQNTYYSVLAAREIGENDLAESLIQGLADHADRLAATPATIDYFATSLATVLLFDESPSQRRDLTVNLLRGQVSLLTGDQERARLAVAEVLHKDPTHELALELNNRLVPSGTFS